MADGASSLPRGVTDAFDRGAIVFSLAGKRYALPIGAVEGVAGPPALSRVPHAPPGLLGTGNLGGQVLPIVDVAALLRVAAPARRYDGGGEVLRVRAAGGCVGLWIDSVEGLSASGEMLAERVGALDLEPVARLLRAVPRFGKDARGVLGDVGELAELKRARVTESFFLVETAGTQVLLPHEAVLEFIEPPPWVAVPGAPLGFLGVGMLRGDALPILSLASLLGLREAERPAVFAVMLLPSGHSVLLGCRRVIGLRSGEEGRHFDPRAAIPRALRRIVTGFATREAAQADATEEDDAVPYLSFMLDKQNYALPVEAVERVVPPQRPVALPAAPSAHPQRIASAIELRGQIVPVVRLAMTGSGVADEPQAYVILRGKSGALALGAEHVDQLVMLRPEQIMPPPGHEPLIDSVAVLDSGDDVLRILAPDRIEAVG